MMDWAGIGALAGLTVAGITVVSFWINFSARIGKAEADADTAKSAAADAKHIAVDAHEKLSIQSQAFAIYREQVAREYIHREVMREVEERLTAAIDRLGDRLDRVLETRGDQNRHR